MWSEDLSGSGDSPVYWPREPGHSQDRENLCCSWLRTSSRRQQQGSRTNAPGTAFLSVLQNSLEHRQWSRAAHTARVSCEVQNHARHRLKFRDRV